MPNKLILSIVLVAMFVTAAADAMTASRAGFVTEPGIGSDR